MLRRPLLLLAVMLVFPSVLLAASEPLTGTIEVSRVNGKVAVQGKSVVWGKLAKGSITAYGTSGAGVPSVSGPNLKVKMVRTGNRQAVVYSGAGIRFMFPRADHNLGFDDAPRRVAERVA